MEQRCNSSSGHRNWAWFDTRCHTEQELKLFGVPIYNRNEREINYLIAGIGYVDIMTSVYVNGRFESLRVFIACHDPKNIPQELLMISDPHSKLVRVQLEGFINIENELLTSLPPDDSLPPLSLWRSRASNGGEHESRPAYRREGTNRKHKWFWSDLAEEGDTGDYGTTKWRGCAS